MRRGAFLSQATCRGQALIESAIVLVLFSFLLFSLMQVMLKLNAETVQKWGVYAGSRARIVGYADPGVQKMFLVGNILNSGRMYSPSAGLTAIPQSAVEEQFIAAYLGPGPVYNNPLLDYEHWPELPWMSPAGAGDQYVGNTEQTYHLEIAEMMPMLEASFGTDRATLESEVKIENHFPLYLDVY